MQSVITIIRINLSGDLAELLKGLQDGVAAGLSPVEPWTHVCGVASRYHLENLNLVNKCPVWFRNQRTVVLIFNFLDDWYICC